jgi:hypothetical protein
LFGEGGDSVGEEGTYNIVGCVKKAGSATVYYVTDGLKVVNINESTLLAWLEKSPNMIRNYALKGAFPEEDSNGNVAGSVIARTGFDDKRAFTVMRKRGNEWLTQTIGVEEMRRQVKAGEVVNVDMRNLMCRAMPNTSRKEWFVRVHFVTEAHGENDAMLRFVGLEYRGDEILIERITEELGPRNLKLRADFFRLFGRNDESLQMKTGTGIAYGVFSFGYLQNLLKSATYKDRVKFSRVAVEVIEYRRKHVRSVTTQTLVGLMGAGQIQGDKYCLKAINALVSEVKEMFQTYTFN